MQALRAGLVYFALVFGTGFVLGTIRVVWVVPHLGTRTAELMETPIMLGVTILAARWTVRRMAVPPVALLRLAMGGIGLAFLLLAEFSFVLWIRGVSLRQYFATRDPVSGTVYYIMLVVFAIIPLVVGRK